MLDGEKGVRTPAKMTVGGALVCTISSEAPERWAVYGVVNWGVECGRPHKYGVYARVTKYMRWINQQMKLH